MTWRNEIREKYEEARQEVALAGGQKRIDKQHLRGKMTARERMEAFFDEGKFTEIEMYARTRIKPEEVKKTQYVGDGVVCGYGKVNGVTVYAISQDATISGGAGGETHVSKICRTLELAISTKSPFVQLCDSGGARIEEGILSLSAYSKLFLLNTQASGYIPQIAAIMGNCAGGSAYSPAMCDILFMVKDTSQFFITGPKVIKALTGEEVTMDELGGAHVHAQHSGQAHFVCENDKECLERIREVLAYITIPKIPYNNVRKIDYSRLGRQLEYIVPENTRQPYDVREVIRCVVDDAQFVELLDEFAKNLVVGFARLDGRTIGIVANQAQYLGGSLDCDAGDKCARFVRFCDCFDIPLLVLVDVPGFFPGTAQEKKGILRHGSKILYAFSEATVPKISLIMRKAYGGAYIAMNSKGIGADIVYAWPIAEIAVMGAAGAVSIIGKKEIAKAEDPTAKKEELLNAYNSRFMNPYIAAEHGYVDEVILPEETRERIAGAFQMLKTKKQIRPVKKHGNIPL